MITYLKSYLSITKKEWNGSVILIVLILLILITPYVGQRFGKDTIINTKDIDKAIAVLSSTTTDKKPFKNNIYYTTLPAKSFSRKPRLSVPLELNAADSATLTTIYGIGPLFARRIIKYRGRLGGFANKQQLNEVYGLDREKYNEIESQVTVNPSRLKKLNVNAADFDDLKRFPYLTFKQMNAIIQYRIQHGDYASADDMREIAILDDETIDKIKPYLLFK